MTDLRSAPVPPPGPADHVRGPEGAPAVVLYADFTCPRCAVAWGRLKDAPVRVAFRHLALKAKHPRAVALAHAAEAAARQGEGRFWALVDSLYADQGHIDDPHLWARCAELNLDVGRFQADRQDPGTQAIVRAHVLDALRGGATVTPTLFVGPSMYPGAPSTEQVQAWASGRAHGHPG
jgi:protein-disulfide isomerase